MKIALLNGYNMVCIGCQKVVRLTAEIDQYRIPNRGVQISTFVIMIDTKFATDPANSVTVEGDSYTIRWVCPNCLKINVKEI